MKRLFKDIRFVVIATVIVLIPAEIFMAVKFILSPQGFWQNIILLGAGIYILGIAQIILLFLGIIFFISYFKVRF